MENWRRLVEAIRQDTISGAAELAERAVGAIDQWLDQSGSMPFTDWRQDLFTLGRALVAAQPSMAPLFNLANEVFLAVDSAQTLGEARQRVRHTTQTFMQALKRSQGRLVEAALPLFTADSRVLTLSYSSTVLEVSRAARARGISVTVLCTEGRPGLEGRELARQLAAAGIEVLFGIDAAISVFASQASLALVGADSLTYMGVVNKVGTTALARAAADAGAPCFVICGRQKCFPAAAPLPDFQPPRPRDEVWPDPPAGVKVWNAYFECTPFALFNGVIVETGILAPEALVRELSAMPVAERWRPQRLDR
jgi:translation initiation factor 2B subunit (eIF-2B alpha/beta/delta family)